MGQRVVVEWTRSSVRVAVARGSGSVWRLQGIYSQAAAVAETSDALRALLKTAKVRSAEAIGVVSREQVITRVMKFPTTNPVELASMAELYAKAQLPYPRDQSIMDYFVVQQEDGFTTLTVIACRRDVVDQQLAVLRRAGLSHVTLLTMSAWGVLGWYRQAHPRSTGGAGQLKQRGLSALARLTEAARGGGAGHAIKEPSLVVNVDDTRTDLVLVADQRILSSRSISQGAQDWQRDDEPTTLLAVEIERSRAAIRKELPGAEVCSLVLTGIGSVGAWQAALTERLSVPVTVLSAAQPFPSWKASAATPLSPVVVGGIACSDKRTLLNLNPPELRVQLRERRNTQELIMASSLCLSVLVAGSGLLALQGVRQRQQAVKLDDALTRIGPLAKRLQEHTRSSKLIAGTLETRRELAALLAAIFHQTPSEIRLETLAFERARHEIVLRGTAPSTQTVLGYLKRLEQIADVTDVDLKYSTRRSTSSGDMTDFELTVHHRATS